MWETKVSVAQQPIAVMPIACFRQFLSCVEYIRQVVPGRSKGTRVGRSVKHALG
jgi:hypothetical protein